MWNEEGRREFVRRVGRVDIEEKWGSLENRVKEALKEMEGEWNGVKEKRGEWWDEEYVRKKKEVRRLRKKGRRGPKI